ncbi:8871_t:CDS:2, partial [Gigaspora margarita]
MQPLKIANQAINAEASTSYAVTAKACTFDKNTADEYMNDKYIVGENTDDGNAIDECTVDENAIDDETNSCENEITEANTIDALSNEEIYDFSSLKVGYTFRTWEEVDSFFKAYGQHYRFAVIKKRVEQCNDGIIRHRSFGCEFGRKYIPKKSININAYHNQQSKRQECEWHINLSFSKKSSYITVTTLVNTHNHELHSESCKYSAKFRSIGKEALTKYPDATFLNMDFTNAIQHYKAKSRKDLETDTSQLLSFLLISIQKKYLTSQILSIKCMEIAQCLYFDTILADLILIEFNDDNESLDDRFIEDVYNARQILLKSIVLKANQNNIKEIWKITNKQPGNNKRKHFIIVLDSVFYICTCMSNISRASRWYCNSKKEAIDYENMIFANLNTSNAQQGQTMVLPLHSFTVPRPVTTNNRCAAARRSKY